MSERRHYHRQPIWQPVNVNTIERRDRVGMIRDMSPGGLLFHSRSRFAIGEQVTVQFRVDAQRHGLAEGTVVRAFRDTCEDNMFPFVTAIRFAADVEVPQHSA